MASLYQISEADLCALEHDLPKLALRLQQPNLDNKTKVRLRRIQGVLSRVRWNYGPPAEIENVPASDGYDS